MSNNTSNTVCMCVCMCVYVLYVSNDIYECKHVDVHRQTVLHECLYGVCVQRPGKPFRGRFLSFHSGDRKHILFEIQPIPLYV